MKEFGKCSEDLKEEKKHVLKQDQWGHYDRFNIATCIMTDHVGDYYVKCQNNWKGWRFHCDRLAYVFKLDTKISLTGD